MRDMFVAKNKPEHNWVGNVKFIKRFYIHLYASIIDLGAIKYKLKFSKDKTLTILQSTVVKNRRFAIKGFQRWTPSNRFSTLTFRHDFYKNNTSAKQAYILTVNTINRLKLKKFYRTQIFLNYIVD